MKLRHKTIWVIGFAVLMLASAVCPAWAATEYEISGNDKDYNPAIAYNPDDDEYLVVWQYYWGPDYDIHARRVDAQGNPLSVVLGVSSNASADETKPRVAYNSEHNKYLVVFEFKSGTASSHIAGRLLNADGSTSGDTFYIASTTRDESAPDVVWNSSALDFFVVWAEDFGSIEFPQRNIYARRVWSDGSMDSEGVPYTIANSSYDEASPAVAHSPSSRRHLIVWSEYQYYGGYWDYDIRGRTVQDYGSPYYYSPPAIYSDFHISTRGNNQVKPRVAYNSEDAGFLAVWEDQLNTSRWEIYGQRMNSIGTKILFNFAISSGTSPPNDRLNPDVSYDKGANAYLVAWEYEYSASDHDIKYRRVSNDGDLLDSETSLAASSIHERFPAVASDGAWHHLVVWEDWTSSVYNIYGEQVNASSDMPPWISPTIPNQTKNEDNPAWNLDLTGYEHDDHDSGTALDWSVSGVNTSLFSASVNIDTDVVTFTPVSNAYGSDVITLTLTDSASRTASQNITVTLNAVNDPPWISPTIPNQTKNEDASPWTLDLTGYEHDVEDSGTNLDWSVSGVNTALLSVVVTDSNNDIITFYPVANAYGSDTITLTLRDSNGIGLTASQDITVTLNAVNDAPWISPTIPNQTKNEDASPWTLDLTGYEHDVEDSGTTLNWTVSDVNTALISVTVTDSNNDIIRFTPVANAYGSDVIRFTLTDSGGKTAWQDITVTLNAVNDSPWISPTIPNQTKTEDAPPWTLDLTAYEHDVEDSGTNLDWSVSDVNPELFSVSVNTTTDVVTFTPELNANGAHVITLTLTDSGGKTDSQQITVTLSPSNDPPYIANVMGQPVPDQTENEDASAWVLDLTPYENDAEDSGTALDWSVSGVDTSLFSVEVDIDTDRVTFTPVPNAHGSNEITLTLRDSGGLVANQNITVTLNPVNDPPYFTSTPLVTAVEDSLYTYHVTAADEDDDDLLIITGTPSWLTVNDHGNGTATLEGTPDDADVGENAVMLTVMDNHEATDTQSFTITVSSVNDAPVITGQNPDPLTTDEETPLAITLDHLLVSDPDNDYPNDFTLTVLPGNNYGVEGNTITPVVDFHGPLFVPVKVSDGLAESESHNVNVTVENTPDTGIRGYVRDVDTEQGIPFAFVFYMTEDEEAEGVAITDDTGYYYLDTPEGEIPILVYAPGYEILEASVLVATGDERTEYNANLLRIEDMVTVSGTIVNCEEGYTPISGALVSADNGNYTFTDENGDFEMELPYGLYWLYIDSPHLDGPTEFVDREEWVYVDVDSSNLGQLCLIPQETRAWVAGVVTDKETGLPIPEAFVNTPDFGFSFFADFDGFYVVSAPGGYGQITVTAERSGYETASVVVPVVPGEATEQDIQLNPLDLEDDHCDLPQACATTLAVNGEPVAGIINPAGDVDWFQFNVVEAEEYKIETSGLGAGADTVIELYRADGTTLVTSDDDGGTDLASKIVWTADAGGVFYVKVRHYSPSGTGNYFIAVTGTDDHCNEPACATPLETYGVPVSGTIEIGGDSDWFVLTPTAGLTYDIQTFDLGDGSDTVIALYYEDGTPVLDNQGNPIFDDDSGAGFGSRIVWEAQVTGPLFVVVIQYQADGRGSYKIRVTASDDHCNEPGPCATYVVPNDTPVSGRFETNGDEDWFQVHAVAGISNWDLTWDLGLEYVIETGNLSDGADTFISVVSPSGEVLAYNDDIEPGNLASRVTVSFETAGIYYIVVRHYRLDGRGSYELNVSAPWASILPTDGTRFEGILDGEINLADLYLFLLKAERSYVIQVKKLSQALVFHPRVRLFGPDGLGLAEGEEVEPGTDVYTIEFTPSSSAIYYVRVDSLGISGTYEISIWEADDHDDLLAEATPVDTDGTKVPGRFESPGDRDWFQFDAVAGQRYIIETTDLDSDCDTVMALYGLDGSGGLVLQGSNDDFGGGLGSRIDWTAPASETYYVLVEHYSPEGTGSYSFSVRSVFADDYGNTPGEAGDINPDGMPVSGQISSAGDVDWFKFDAEVGKQYIIETFNLDDQCDTVIRLYGPDGSTVIATDDDSGPGRGSRIVWQANETDTYYVRVRHYSSQGRGAYQFAIQERPTCVSVGRNEVVQNALSNDAAFQLYCVDVNARDRVDVILQGPSANADFDLYLNMGAPPSLTDYDARSFSPTSQEWATLTVQSSGVLFIMVRSYSGLGDYSMEVKVTPLGSDCLTLEEGVEQTGALSGPEDGLLYCLDVEAGDRVKVTLNGPEGGADFDLYVKQGSPPTLEDYDARGITPFADETLSVGPLTTGKLFVWVLSYSGSGEYSVIAETVDEACMVLETGVPQEGSLTYPTDDDLYCIDVDEMERLTVSLNGPDENADFDLYVRLGAPPTLSEYDWAETDPGSDENIANLVLPSKGTVYIRVYSYYGSGDYDITASLISVSAHWKLFSDPNKVLFVKGQIIDALTSEPIQPSRFCITVKDLGKFCYNSDPQATSQISFIPGGYFFFIMDRLVGDYTLTLTDVPCYLGTNPQAFTEAQLSSLLFEEEVDPEGDCDGDVMENDWEKKHSLNMYKNDAALDLDGDGYTNLQEFNGGSDPDDEDSIPLGAKFVQKGDVSGDDVVDLADAIIGLQALAGADISKVIRPNYVTSEVDVNGDGTLGMAEVIYIIQKVSEVR